MGPGMHGGGSGQTIGIVIGVLVMIAVLLMRNRRPRRLRLEAMWIRPAIFLFLIGATVIAAPPSLTPLSLGTITLALILSAGLGWQRGRFMRIEVHPETHDITARASPAGLLFILAIVGMRLGLRNVASEVRGVPTALIATALIVFVGAMMIAQSVEMYLRARKLLGEAQAAKAGPLASPGANPPIVR